MLRLLIIGLLIIAMLPVESPLVSGTVVPGEPTVYPETARTLVISLKTHRPLWALVVQVHIRNAQAVFPNDDGACTGMGQDGRGGAQETVCTWLDIPADTVITRTVTLQPVHIVSAPINRACAPASLTIGTPYSIAANGETIAYHVTAWSAYQPGYCFYVAP